MSVQSFEVRLESVIDAKEVCLSILRNSVTNSSVVENSLSLRRERQAELVQVYETLVSLISRFTTFCQIFVKSTRFRDKLWFDEIFHFSASNCSN